MELRPSVQFAQSHFNGRNDLICMEVGVLIGLHATAMEHHLHPKMLYLVDLWEPCNWTYKNEDYRNADQNYETTKNKFKDKANITIIKGRSHDVMPKMEENSFDFIYIDGDHDVTSCRYDILNAIRLVKIGGIVGGHDYGAVHLDANSMPKCNGNHAVPGAVYSVFKGMKIQTGGDMDWWVVMNEEVKGRIP